MNPTEETLIYHIYLGSKGDNLIELTTTQSNWYILTDLEENTTYYWKIIPVAGSVQGICFSGIWHFTVNTSFIPFYNITVEFDLTELEIVRGKGAIFNITLTNNGNVATAVTLSVIGELAEYANIVQSVGIPANGSEKIPVAMCNTSLLNTGNYELFIKITYPGGNKTFTIPVNITSGEIPTGDDDIDEGKNTIAGFTKAQLFIGGGVTFLIIIILVAISIIRKKKKTEERAEMEKSKEPISEEVVVEEVPAPPPAPELVVVPELPLVSGAPEIPPPSLPPAPPELPLEPVPSSMENLIPNYIMTHKIASGGFATVYRAIGPKGQPVAIKLPKFLDETVSASTLEQFQAEADMWKKLKHKNIVTFYEGDIRPVPYMVIEYMEGGSLLEMLKGESMPIDTAMALIQDILSGLAYAHRMASVHRDIKPENILFTADGTPKITDWGIGKAMWSVSQSKTIGPKGTLAYSAPEQISEEKYGHVDWSTDVFQLGILFYEMLTGKNPFKASDPVGTINNIVNDIPIPPSSLRSGIPPEIDTVILRALEKDKGERYSSADSMLEELKRVLKTHRPPARR